MDPVPDPLLLRKYGSAGNRTRDLCICSQKLRPLDHRGGRFKHTQIQNLLFFPAFRIPDLRIRRMWNCITDRIQVSRINTCVSITLPEGSLDWTVRHKKHRSEQTFQKSRSHTKILGGRKVIKNQIPHLEPTNIQCHRSKAQYPRQLCPALCTSDPRYQSCLNSKHFACEQEFSGQDSFNKQKELRTFAK